jgi:hypothetical protein
LPERQRHRRPAFDVPTDKAIREDPEVDGRLGGVIDDGGPVFFRERQDAEDLPHALGGPLRMNGVTHRSDVRPGGGRSGEERERRRGSALGPVRVLDAMPAPRRSKMLAQELAGLRGEGMRDEQGWHATDCQPTLDPRSPDSQTCENVMSFLRHR